MNIATNPFGNDPVSLASEDSCCASVAACCAPKVQETCCEPAQKDECCGTAPLDGGCGCQ